MALTLTNAITATQTTFDVTGSDALNPGDLKTIGSETMEIRTANRGTPNYGESAYWRVNANRGSLGTAKAGHAAGASVTTATFGGGGGSISVTDGTTTVDPATSLRVASVADEGGGVASFASVVVNDDDPGAIGANNVWVQTNVGGNDDYTQVWVRNAANDAWTIISPVVNGDGETSVLIASPSDVAELNLEDGAGSYLTANTNLGLFAGSKGFFINNATGVHIGTAVTDPAILRGSVDPSADAGIAAPFGSVFIRNNGEVFWKTAEPDTGWTGLPRNALTNFAASAGINLSTVDTDLVLTAGGPGDVVLAGTTLTFNASPIGTQAANVPDCVTDDPTDLQTTLNALLAAIKASGEMAAD